MFDLKGAIANNAIVGACIAGMFCACVGAVTMFDMLAEYLGSGWKTAGLLLAGYVLFILVYLASDYAVWRWGRRRKEKLARELDEIFRRHQGENL